jgi:hypothetical protein
VKIAVYASMFANIALSIIQGKSVIRISLWLHPTVNAAVYAAVSSLSLSFFATAVDSVFDPMSNILLWWLNRKSNKLDTNKWPVGGARLETIGNICYGTRSQVFCLSLTLAQLLPGILYVYSVFGSQPYSSS